MEAIERIKEVYHHTVQASREVARLEEAVRQANFKLRLARCRLSAMEDDLVKMLPVGAQTRKRLTFALAQTATAEAILESLSSNSTN